MSKLPALPELREKIARHLDTVEDATAKQITVGIKLSDYPSLVVKTLNAMRTDGDVEAEQRKGELAYWLARPLAQVLDLKRAPADMTPAAPAKVVLSRPGGALGPKKRPGEITIVPHKGDQTRRIALMKLIEGRTLAEAISMTEIAAQLGISTEGVRWLLKRAESAGVAARINRRNGKQGSWIYDPRTDGQVPDQPQPAVGHNAGSSASASTPPAEGAAVQPEPAPVQPADVSPAAPVAADETSQSLNDYLLSVIGDIRDAVSDHSSMLSDLPARIRTLWVTFEQQTDDFERIHQILAERVCGGIDPVELSEVECAQRAAQMIDEMLADIPKREAELRNQKALVEKLEHLLQSARNEAEHLRKHAAHADVDMVNHPPHYQGKVECIDAIEAALGPDGFAAYCRGNAIKYSFRAGRKGPSAEDLAKAQWYLARATATASVTPIAA